MPIYEYQCHTCHHQFEAIQKINDEPLTRCEHCGKNTAKRLVSAAGFQLKGTGWYVTDFKNKSTPASSTGSQSESTSTKKEESTTSTETSSTESKSTQSKSKQSNQGETS